MKYTRKGFACPYTMNKSIIAKPVSNFFIFFSEIIIGLARVWFGPLDMLYL